MQGLNKLKDTMRGAKLPPVAGLALLLLVGALVVSAAPRGGHNPAPLHAAALVSTSSPVATQSPHTAATATATKAPTKHINAPQAPAIATDTPTPPPPTDTPVPPTPTATPAPSWHTVGSYSGSASQALPSFTTASPWRMNWTCTPGTGTTEGFSFSVTVDGANLAAFGNICDSSMTTSATWTPCTGAAVCNGSHTYAIVAGQNNGAYPMSAWTATVEVYY